MTAQTKHHSNLKLLAPSPIELAMMLLSLLSVVVVLTLTFVKLDDETERLLFYIDTSICVIFLSHFGVQLLRARDKVFFLRHHWIDLVASIPAIETLRFARLFQILRVIRLLRMSRSLFKQLVRQRRQATVASLLVAMVTILTLSSVAILLVEAGAEGANIHTAEQAIWWAMVTISTVGYGDHYPVTSAGHFVGALVIICGVSFFGVISGYMASLFVMPDEEEMLEAKSDSLRQDLDAVLARMEANQAALLKEVTELKQALSERSDRNK
ncbi:potassium channel family protein [Shewanella cyperi]|uniref:potassium channel family protein n=1 Tax=Shewanella cyperi TaxID=2814292 RepID=UPI001A94FD27|nr:potassium channel family protein [Shewanella cyperi]QSX41541.1 ion transporter [Shewanella cyperi]